MQKTTFPFVCIILDDASTDREPEIIKKYIKDNFDLESKYVAHQETSDYVMTFAQHKKNRNCFFAVYFLKYNHWSVNKSKLPYVAEYLDGNQYNALCEGDDYWIDPLKLQRQFDYMENHPECTMTCCRAKRYSESKEKSIGEQYCRKSDGILSPIDIINRTGLYIPTCSIVYKPWIQDNYPDYCQNCKVRDYPLQITASMKGSVYYFNKCMCVSRIGNRDSWMGRQCHESVDPERLKVVYGQTKMFQGFEKDNPNYVKVFQDKISEHILRNMPLRRGHDDNDILRYQEIFSEELGNMTFKWMIFYMICKSRFVKIKKIYMKVFLQQYLPMMSFNDSYLNRVVRFFRR